MCADGNTGRGKGENMECLPPASIAESMVASGERKANLSVAHLLILGVLAGAYIGFVGQFFTIVTSDLSQYALYWQQPSCHGGVLPSDSLEPRGA